MPLATSVEPFSECMTLGLCLAYVASPYISPYLVFFLHVVGWIAVDAAIMGGLGGPTDRVEYWVAWVFREVTAFPLYCYSMFGNSVVWRGRGYKLVFDGTVKVDEAEKEAGCEKYEWTAEQEKEVLRNEMRRRY